MILAVVLIAQELVEHRRMGWKESFEKLGTFRECRALQINPAVEPALRWLETCQREDGSWRENGEDVTGLVLLTFAGAGHSHLGRAHRRSVRDGLARVLSLQRDDGRIAEDDVAAAAALMEIRSLTASPLLADPARRAMEYVRRMWDPGEWGIRMRRACRIAGFEGPWNDRIAHDPAQRLAFRIYFERDSPDPTMAEEILRESRNLNPPDPVRWHHASVALYLFDGPNGQKWSQWYGHLQKTLLPLQGPDGSWSGSVRDTAVHAMTLETPCRLRRVFGLR